MTPEKAVGILLIVYGGATKISMTPEEAVEILLMVYGRATKISMNTRGSCRNFTYGLWGELPKSL